jgi:hypothetical protein
MNTSSEEASQAASIGCVNCSGFLLVTRSSNEAAVGDPLGRS